MKDVGHPALLPTSWRLDGDLPPVGATSGWCTSGGGEVQSARMATPFPDGVSGQHQITVTVG